MRVNSESISVRSNAILIPENKHRAVLTAADITRTNMDGSPPDRGFSATVMGNGGNGVVVAYIAETVSRKGPCEVAMQRKNGSTTLWTVFPSQDSSTDAQNISHRSKLDRAAWKANEVFYGL